MNGWSLFMVLHIQSRWLETVFFVNIQQRYIRKLQKLLSWKWSIQKMNTAFYRHRSSPGKHLWLDTWFIRFCSSFFFFLILLIFPSFAFLYLNLFEEIINIFNKWGRLQNFMLTLLFVLLALCLLVKIIQNSVFGPLVEK